MSGEDHRLRLINYTDPVTGNAYEFLTNEMDLPPGVLVELYRRRWDVEKVYDQIKNKFGEQKAWGTSLVAKELEARALAAKMMVCSIGARRLKWPPVDAKHEEPNGERVPDDQTTS